MTAPLGIDEIPGPRGLPLVGNILDVDRHNPVTGFMELARQYGPIFKLSVPGGTRLMVSGADLVDELCDEARFDKKVGGGLASVRETPVGRGLFTADTDDPLWHRAHNILMPPFSMQSMRDYMPKMLDIADQLMDKWERLNPDDDVDVAVDMTALTLDTIALCGFGYRFNSFYRETPHPFVMAMMRSLLQAQNRARQLPVQSRLNIRAARQAEEDQAYMLSVVQGIIDDRRAQGEDADATDLLGRMLTGVDRKTGEKLPDENIIAQCITFLIAGHETTSGLLSFAVYYLLENPEVVERARAEVDDVLAETAVPTFDQVHRLTYVSQVLEETLRLWPTAPFFTRQPFEDTVIGGRYAIPKGTGCSVIIPMLHRDQAVWGPDAERFDPDHMSPEHRSALPLNAFKPFGTGQRACIGRQFALQEATLVLGMLLQRFELVDYLDYQLTTKTTLTVKPEGLRVRVRPRAGRRIERVARAGASVPEPDASRERTSSAPAVAPVPLAARHGTPLQVLYGSNLGTAEGIATELAREGTERGYTVTLGALDEHVAALGKDGAVVLVCSSYNGTPPDNAALFCRWLTDPATPADVCAGTAYTVFGCGNTEWASTYQAVPALLDEELQRHGATRTHPRGGGDAHGDFDKGYRDWHSGLWAGLAAAFDLPEAAAEPAVRGPRLSVSLVNRQLTNPVIMSYRAQPAVVRANRELQTADGVRPARSTRHVEIALPAGTTYQAGDHLGVLPRNDVELIQRVMRRFTLDAGMYATIIPNSGVHSHLPTDEEAPLLGVLGSCVELQDVASRSSIETLASYADDPDQRASLQALAGDDEDSQARYQKLVLQPNRSILDLLELFPSCAPPFEVFLDLLPALRPRYYSISSSPLVSPEVCSITAGVLSAPARSGDGVFNGVCSTYLNRMRAGSTVFVFVHEPTIPFRPPANPHTPMIMVGAGTGVAPFRGFLQERAALRAQGVPVAQSLLFFGCRSPESDQLYVDEMTELESEGVVRVVNAFSRCDREPRRYVQDAMVAQAGDVWNLLQHEASIFVCGNAGTMAPGVRAAVA
ncbi:MAG: bifunctional cytochrome P450/NADPH--P450 reductase, partial [Actinomycetes bacterium]